MDRGCLSNTKLKRAVRARWLHTGQPVDAHTVLADYHGARAKSSSGPKRRRVDLEPERGAPALTRHEAVELLRSYLLDLGVSECEPSFAHLNEPMAGASSEDQARAWETISAVKMDTRSATLEEMRKALAMLPGVAALLAETSQLGAVLDERRVVSEGLEAERVELKESTAAMEAGTEELKESTAAMKATMRAK